MSFRTRLSLFFVAIVIVPMFAVGFVVLALIGRSEDGKADARIAASANVAAGLYKQALNEARKGTLKIAGDRQLAAAVASGQVVRIQARERVLSRNLGLLRISVTVLGTPVAVGDAQALAQYVGTLDRGDRVAVSRLLPAKLVRVLSTDGVRAVVVERGVIAASTLPDPPPMPLRATALVKINNTTYRMASFSGKDHEGGAYGIGVYRDDASTSARTSHGRRVAAAILLGFLALASVLAMFISRSLQGQIATFLTGARRLGSGDFSTTVAVDGHDEFAQLGGEFNKMSSELEQRLQELREERARLEDSIRRSGETFAAKLDAAALLDLGLHTVLDAVRADAGRASAREGGVLVQRADVGDLVRHGDALQAAEREALRRKAFADYAGAGNHALAMPLGVGEDGHVLGLFSVARAGDPFSLVGRELFASLAGQAAVSLENVALHEQVQRQAVTDELTGLSNHREFQRVMDAELQRANRQGNEVALLMLDVDNFKRVNDTYGHPQGDEVLRAVARVVRDTSRIGVDTPARYGGEEMALILPETDLDGAYGIAERVRQAIEDLRVPLLGGDDVLRVTASLGVAAATGSTKANVIAAADRALYEAKHSGKNRTARGFVQPAPL